jgi:tRNA1(Val) A37 N6-methylase TrmN6
MLDEIETTEDAALGGRLVLRQPKKGHRFGHDAILLAAATDAQPSRHAVEFGAGVGVAGLAVAQRVSKLSMTLVEIDPVLARLARENAERNGLAGCVKVVNLDVNADAMEFARAGLSPCAIDHVLMNPPFNDARHNVSPDPGRRLAHVAADDTLARWADRACALLKPHGTLTLIWRATGLADVLAALSGFGAISIVPVHPRPESAAIRVLIQAVKSGAAPLTLFPPLMLNDADGKPSAEAEAILRHGATIPI